MVSERRLTVFQLLPALEHGGVERGTLEIADALVRAGHRSVVVSAGGALAAELVESGSEHVAWPLGAKRLRTLLLVPRLRRLLTETRADVVHVRSRLPGWIGYLAWRAMPAATRPRLVSTVHGFYSVSRYSAVMTRGERVIAVSEAIAEYIAHCYPDVEPERVQIIPRGVDPAAFPFGHRPSREWRMRFHREFPDLEGKRLLTLPGRLTRLKGHAEFLDLIGRLRGRHPDVHGLIVGGGEPHQSARLTQRVMAEHLPVTLTGARADVREILASSSVVLSLSTQPESFGRTVLEALRLGVPTIGFDHGGVGEILARVFPEGRVPLGNADTLLQTVTRFIEQPPRVIPNEAYTLREMQDATLSLYEALSRKGTGTN